MRKICIDVGTDYIGVSMSDATNIIAQNFETIKRKGVAPDIDRIVDIVCEYDVDTIVIGMPLHLNGQESAMSRLVRDFTKKLEKKLKYTDRLTREVETLFWDERLTTISAERVMIESGVRRENRKKSIDQVAASLILQAYLDSKR